MTMGHVVCCPDFRIIFEKHIPGCSCLSADSCFLFPVAYYLVRSFETHVLSESIAEIPSNITSKYAGKAVLPTERNGMPMATNID